MHLDSQENKDKEVKLVNLDQLGLPDLLEHLER